MAKEHWSHKTGHVLVLSLDINEEDGTKTSGQFGCPTPENNART
jgi:hypothetical protein